MKRLGFLPLILFLIFILGLGYLILRPPVPPPPPTEITDTPLSPTPDPEIISTSSLSPTEIAPHFTSPTATPTATDAPTPTLSPPTITPTNTPTPAPTPIIGTVNVGALNVRRGTSTQFEYVGAVYEGDNVTILGRNSAEDWLQIVTPDQRIGWAAAKFITIDSSVGSSLAVLPTPPLPSQVVSGLVLQGSVDFLRDEIDVEGRSIKRSLGPFEEHWYTFFEDDPETVIVFMFDPNVNLVGDHFIGYNVEFFLHDENQIPVWPPGDAEALAERNIGAGGYPGKDLNGNLADGELVWRGGGLGIGVRYYLRFVNRSSQIIQYCLAPADVNRWTCAN